jgi:hypothetical protein
LKGGLTCEGHAMPPGQSFFQNTLRHAALQAASNSRACSTLLPYTYVQAINFTVTLPNYSPLLGLFLNDTI